MSRSRPTGATSRQAIRTRSPRSGMAETGRLVQTLVGHSELLFGMAFSPDDKTLLTGSLDNTARLWDIASWQGDPPPHRSHRRRLRRRLHARRPVRDHEQRRQVGPDLGPDEPARGRHAGRSDLVRLCRGLLAGWQQDLHGQRRWHRACCGTRRRIRSSRGCTRTVAWMTPPSRPTVDIFSSRTRDDRPSCGMSRPPAWFASCSVRREASPPVSRPTGG